MTTDQKIARKFAIASFFADYRAELLKMKIPSLIIQCSEDAVVPLQVGDYLHAHLTDNVLKVIQTKGHFPHLSKPKEVVNLITAYLDDN